MGESTGSYQGVIAGRIGLLDRRGRGKRIGRGPGDIAQVGAIIDILTFE